MSLSEKEKNSTRNEWRKLGFYYDIRDDEKQWYMAGSKEGLLNFYNILVHYVADPHHDEISSHEHYGPYMYLEIMTSEKPNINDHAIQGSKQDLRRLSEMFKSKLRDTEEGQHFIIGKDYVAETKYSVLVEIMEDTFDPALVDPQLQG